MQTICPFQLTSFFGKTYPVSRLGSDMRQKSAFTSRTIPKSLVPFANPLNESASIVASFFECTTFPPPRGSPKEEDTGGSSDCFCFFFLACPTALFFSPKRKSLSTGLSRLRLDPSASACSSRGLRPLGNATFIMVREACTEVVKSEGEVPKNEKEH